MLQSPFVEFETRHHHSTFILVECYGQPSVANGVPHDVDDLHHRIDNASVLVERSEVAVVQHPLVQKVLGVQLHEHARKQNNLHHFPLFFIFAPLAQQLLANLYLDLDWLQHLMVNRCVQGFEESVCVLFFLELHVRCDVCDIEDLAPLVILSEVLSLHYQGFWGAVWCVQAIFRLHFVHFDLIFIDFIAVFFINDLVQ